MSRRHASLAISAVCAASLVAVASVLAFAGDDLPGAPTAAKRSKLSAPLVAVVAAERRSGTGLAVARANGLYVKKGKIRIVAETHGTRQAARRAVLGAGGEIEATHANLVQALVAPGRLEALARQTVVVFVRAPKRPLLG